jgi:RNA polymerase sigma-B factor
MVEYAGLVERTARKFSGIESYDDLVQVGFIGLLNALAKFDPTAGVRFNTYATYLVAGEIKHYLRDRAQTIRHPAWLQELRHKVNKAANVLQQTHGRVPTEREIAEAVGVSESAVREVFQTQEMTRVASLDATLPGDDDGTTEGERLDAADFCPEQLSFEDRLLLENAMQQLRDLEREVLIHFHFDSMNQTEIAAKLNISCNYVSHILRQSLAKLRKILTTEEVKDRMLQRESQQVQWELIDPATGAYTEAYLRNRLEEEIHRAIADGTQVSLVIVNFRGLDGMRRFYGEQSVTDFMANATEFLKSNVRRLDVVAQYGQTGFGMILPATGSNVAVVRQRLMKKAAGWTLGRVGVSGSVSAEIGFAIAPVDGRSATQLINAIQMESLTDARRAA